MADTPDVATLDVEQILRILQVGRPFIMLDRITESVAGKYARGVKCVSFNDPVFGAAAPASAELPRVMVLEAMVQTSHVLAYVSAPFDPVERHFVLLRANHCKWRQAIVPGDRLHLYAEVTEREGNQFRFTAEASVDDTVCVEVDLVGRIEDR